MVDSVAATTPQAAFNAALLELSETTALTNPTSDVNNGANDNGFASAVANAEVTPPTPQTTSQSAAAGLLALDTPTLTLFNEAQSEADSAGIGGNLSTVQLQELGILQDDAAKLEAASALSSHVPLNGASATTVDLSVAAQNIVAAGSGNVAVGAQASLSTDQLAQVGQVIAPLSTEPLTPELVLQIQAQLAARQINPLQISLSTLLLVQNYIASMQPAATENTETTNVVETETPAPDAPVTPVDKVAVEDSAILT